MVRQGIESPPAGLAPVEDRRVLEAMRAVPRHEFVPGPLRGRAYENRPLPIGHDQTISQPYIVARMTELLELEPGEKVLEIGTGSGYQAAVLAEITDSVYSIEIVGELARTARQRLRRLGYDGVRVRHGDGWAGWPGHAPFDAIVVTAAPEEVPPPLVEQLAPGGRMVIPVGPQLYGQTLTLIRKDRDGTVTREEISGVRFVPFRRDDGGDGEG
jgi:protein-L-isoaspartate(D-aspartate) O-methyltransferase